MGHMDMDMGMGMGMDMDMNMDMDMGMGMGSTWAAHEQSPARKLACPALSGPTGSEATRESDRGGAEERGRRRATGATARRAGREQRARAGELPPS
jgi:hypothetical protein